MKLGSCIHLEELRSTLCSFLRLDLLFQGSLTNVEFLYRSFSQKLKGLEPRNLGHAYTLKSKGQPFNFET